MNSPAEKKRRDGMHHRDCVWSDLPSDLLALISAKTPTPGDHARFSAVCRSWKDASSATQQRDLPSPAHFYSIRGQLRPLLPFLLDSHGVQHGQFLLVDAPAPLCHCIGSSRGLLLLYDSWYRLFLFDPRTATSTRVPQPNFPEVLQILPSESGKCATFFCPREGVGCDKFLGLPFACPTTLTLSSSTSSECVALCYYYKLRNFIYWRSGDDCWTLLPCQEPLTFADSVYYEGRFYIVDGRSFKAFVCDIGPSTAAVRNIPIVRSSIEAIYKAIGTRRVEGYFLVECHGDLLLAVWSAPASAKHRDYIRLSALDLFKLDTREEEAAWVEQRDLGCHALILGPNESFSLSTHDFQGFEPNCFYVSAGSSGRGGCDYFVYRLDSGTVEIVYLDQVQCQEGDCETFWIAPRARN